MCIIFFNTRDENSSPVLDFEKPTYSRIRVDVDRPAYAFTVHAARTPYRVDATCGLPNDASGVVFSLPVPYQNLGVREVERRLNDWLFNFPSEQRLDIYLALRAALRVVAPDWVSAKPCRLHLPALNPTATADALNCCL